MKSYVSEHQPETKLMGQRHWSSLCPCGWFGPIRAEQKDADIDGAQHDSNGSFVMSIDTPYLVSVDVTREGYSMEAVEASKDGVIAERYRAVCDGCGFRGPWRDTPNIALEWSFHAQCASQSRTQSSVPPTHVAHSFTQPQISPTWFESEISGKVFRPLGE